MNARPVYRHSRWGAAGVSLIEALVALAVMAFGILGVVGMQSTMRAGADISRQRSEAVRIAQERMEQLRNYSVLLTADKASSSQFAYQEIAAASAADVAASHANTTFRLETVVPTVAASDAMAAVRQVRVIVTWADRSASVPNQRVELTSAIAPLPMEMSALHAMRTDRSPLTRAYGRNSAIPKVATDNGDGTSTFSPPGLTGVTWIFNNGTGLITKTCSPPSTCVDTQRWLLSGYLAFATGATPQPSEAEAPVDDLPIGVNLSMSVEVLEPAGTPDENCAIGTVAGQARRVYYCAVPVEDVFTDRYWSGRVKFGTLPLSSTLNDNTVTNFKVCRYTPETSNLLPTPPATLPTVPTGQAVGDYNSRHPYIYYRVNGSLQNKNFLVISAGDGTVSFGCPTENSSTPIESNTLPHQPVS